jgi:hypothetical protein
VLHGGVEDGEIELPCLTRPFRVGVLPLEGLDVGSVLVCCLNCDDFGVVVVEYIVIEAELCWAIVAFGSLYSRTGGTAPVRSVLSVPNATIVVHPLTTTPSSFVSNRLGAV